MARVRIVSTQRSSTVLAVFNTTLKRSSLSTCGGSVAGPSRHRRRKRRGPGVTDGPDAEARELDLFHGLASEIVLPHLITRLRRRPDSQPPATDGNPQRAPPARVCKRPAAPRSGRESRRCRLRSPPSRKGLRSPARRSCGRPRSSRIASEGCRSSGSRPTVSAGWRPERSPAPAPAASTAGTSPRSLLRGAGGCSSPAARSSSPRAAMRPGSRPRSIRARSFPRATGISFDSRSSPFRSGPTRRKSFPSSARSVSSVSGP